MAREIYATIEIMLEPSTLSELEGATVTQVEREDFRSVDGLSGGTLLRVHTDTGGRYVVKRFSEETDWIMQVTEDHQARAVVAWQSGLLDDLPVEICHEVLACAQDGEGRAILLRDVGDSLIPPGDDLISRDEHERFIDAMAALHARFDGHSHIADPARGFCSLLQRYGALSPTRVKQIVAGSAEIPPLILEGWSLFPELVAPDVSDLVMRLLEAPSPLCQALEAHEQTVIHGDWKLGNLGIRRDSAQVVLLDWAVVGPAPGVVDLGWYLAVNCARMPLSKEETISFYRSCLERRLGRAIPDDDWQRQIDLALLGAFVLLGWPKALGAVRGQSEETRARERAELAWWSQRTRDGARWL